MKIIFKERTAFIYGYWRVFDIRDEMFIFQPSFEQKQEIFKRIRENFKLDPDYNYIIKDSVNKNDNPFESDYRLLVLVKGDFPEQEIIRLLKKYNKHLAVKVGYNLVRDILLEMDHDDDIKWLKNRIADLQYINETLEELYYENCNRKDS